MIKTITYTVKILSGEADIEVDDSPILPTRAGDSIDIHLNVSQELNFLGKLLTKLGITITRDFHISKSKELGSE